MPIEAPAGVAAPPSRPADSAAPAHRHLGVALAVISTAQLMVVLDASIVNIALPSIKSALHFSPASLEWVISGYTLAFGGLLLLGGRTGDLFGRRRMFMIGVGLFTFASLLGGFATSETWLIGARVLQGVGGAIASPTALSLIASTFSEGPARNRAMGVYAAMSGAGGAFGVLLGGILTSALSWRWVLFVNVPIGLFVVLVAPWALAETETRTGRLDLPGALTATSGMTLLVYGLIHVTSSSWSSAGTLLPLAAAAVLLATFVLIESRSKHALMPLHIFANRNRSGAYAIMLAIGTAVFAMFFFLTLFVQNVLGFSPLRAGVSFLPFALTIMVVAGIASQVVGKVGPRLLLMAGTASATGGLLWFSTATVDTTYWGGIFGPMLLIAGGMALCFVPLTLTAVSGVRRDEAGIASALLNTGQQVGGSLGLAVLGTIAFTATRDQLRQASTTSAAARTPAAIHNTLNVAATSGYTTAFLVGAGIMAVAFILAATIVRPPKTAMVAAVEVPVAA